MKKLSFLFLTAFLCMNFVFGQNYTWQTSTVTEPHSAFRAASAAYSNGNDQRLYVFGGYNTSNSVYDETSIYDVNGDTWSAGDTIPMNSKGGAAACTGDDIYLLVGRVAWTNTNDFLKYNVIGDSWTAVADCPVAVKYAAMEYNYDNGLIYLAGGVGNSSVYSDSVFAYNPATDTWTACTNLPFNSHGGSVLIYDGNDLYHVGGTTDDQYSIYRGTIDPVDPTIITWLELTPCSSKISTVSAGYIGNDEIIASYKSTNQIYNITTDTWSATANKPISTKGGNYGAFNMGDHYMLAVAGGYNSSNQYVDHVESFIGGATSAAGILVNLSAQLEGAYSPMGMNTNLNSQGYLPLSQPYNSAPWGYSGTESVTAIPNTDVVDWVLVELRDALGGASTATPASTIGQQAGFILKNGAITDLDGISPLSFDVSVSNNLFIVLHHRNHIGIMSANAVTNPGGGYIYDFSTGGMQAYGGSNAHKEIVPGVWGMMAGDANANNEVGNIDKNDFWNNQIGTSGYLFGDFDMSGTVNISDKDKWSPNSGKGSQVPE